MMVQRASGTVPSWLFCFGVTARIQYMFSLYPDYVPCSASVSVFLEDVV
jgi:hypothetical protein